MALNSALAPITNMLGSGVGSASNVMNYDSNASALDNMFNYAINNNSASAYEAALSNKWISEREDSAIQRAIADAEKAGISKYQLFQSGNAAASSPSSAAAGMSSSYEKRLDRKTEMSKTIIQTVSQIVSSLISSATKLM